MIDSAPVTVNWDRKKQRPAKKEDEEMGKKTKKSQIYIFIAILSPKSM
jgi:hypothetical protein